MQILRRMILCNLGYHKRSKRRARHDGRQHVSECVGCGRVMRKDMRQGWMID